ncbi:hypothetical protein ALC57_02542 [Trachymyrmex cornetzi]|uniref:CCHC-type domain-containing protein n=1 Tax=Trachymyrmex cornetzi TaxID=471704 RepID=A0A195EIW5_9HYME|nr:hypothetical protein ALC57_02542 [Trachymyrmex cornetzi]
MEGERDNRRVSKTAAVQISCRGEISYAEVMRIAKSKVDINSLEIPELRPRKARTGALLLEVPGTEGAKKADRLAEKLKEALGSEQNVLITRPEKVADVRLRDLEDSTTKEDILTAIAKKGECPKDSIKIGEINQTNTGLGTVWLKCPLAAAKKVTKDRRIRVGWTTVRIELLSERPTQCFRCLETGHVRHQCRSDKDRTTVCYRCGQEGHNARERKDQAHCIICAERGLKANHRMGGQACKPHVSGWKTRVKSTPLKLVQEATRNDNEMTIDVDPGTKNAPMEIINVTGEVETNVARSMAACSVNDPKTAETTQDSMIEDMEVDNPQEWKTPEAKFTQEMDWPKQRQNWSTEGQELDLGKEGEGGISMINQNG